VGDGFLPIVEKLYRLVGEARDPLNKNKLPDGYRTIRVKNSLHDLQDQLAELRRLAKGVSRKQPPTVFDDQVVQKITETVIRELRNLDSGEEEEGQESSEGVA
jgi:hypothetical protein